MGNKIEAVEFPSHGITVRGAHFRPQTDALRADGAAPCVVMAHGLGGVRAARLDAYAERFAAAGLHVLVFDYRYFGESDGEPRQHFNIRAQLDDWAAAIAYARQLDGVDAKRIALWGSSFSGGHVITAAVEDGRVRAVSSQGPMMDGFAAFMNLVHYAGVLQALRVSAHAIWDTLLIPTGRRHCIPLVAEPGELAVMTTEDALPGYSAIVPPDWRNEITASWMLELPLYRPITKAARLPCPTLICICTQDSVAPAAAAERTAAAAGERAEIRRYDIGHFDIYVGEGFERAVSDQTEFFCRVLRAAGG
ncbi:alpha/beta hydrolase [Sinimarinibacterium thermocellulolyticum]|uniref:Alpha/beta fold hydrolase n=1 Tax=Sinimarinibacterium thermocellulolyticum TaxID=3170016 RepID=A0ABV2A890_9GAMM